MENIIDARGLNCPQPVILTKRAMSASMGKNLTTIVNQNVALENVTKLAKSQGYDFQLEEKGDDFYIHMFKSEQVNINQHARSGDIAILVKSKFFGEGDEELGNILMNGFLYALNELDGQIKHLIFMNSGVALTIEGSPVLEHLEALEEKGIEILSCGTCLDFYGLKESLKVGGVTNMYTAVEIIANASKSITL